MRTFKTAVTFTLYAGIVLGFMGWRLWDHHQDVQRTANRLVAHCLAKDYATTRRDCVGLEMAKLEWVLNRYTGYQAMLDRKEVAVRDFGWTPTGLYERWQQYRFDEESREDAGYVQIVQNAMMRALEDEDARRGKVYI